MRQIYLQKAFYQLAKHAPVQITEGAKRRLQVLSAWYNRQRLHSSLDYLSPAEFEQIPRH